MNFVIGFAFSSDHSKVLLINKGKPYVEEGKCNGCGGLVKPIEKSINALVREFRRETMLDSTEDSWLWFHTLHTNSSFEERVDCYATDTLDVFKASGSVNEPVYPYTVGTNGQLLSSDIAIVRNLQFLLPMALHSLQQRQRALKPVKP